MGRRKQGELFDVMEATARAPWWVGLLLAGASYLLLHWVATRPVPTTVQDLQQLSQYAGKQIWISLATVVQYVLPLVFGVGAGLSVFARRKRQALHRRVTTVDGALDHMSWQDFELLVGEFFRRRGFSVREVGGGGADGGVDLIISSGSDRYVVQCKKWKAMSVGVTVVRELYGVMTAMGAAGGFVVTNGAFTKEALRFAEGREIELVKVNYLMKEVGQDQIAARDEPSSGTRPPDPVCPTCAGPMELKTARKGAHAGRPFWGCNDYPRCRGIRGIPAA